MVKGWFVGDFESTAYRTSACEVCFKQHKEGEVWPVHYHKLATEINYLIQGEMTLQNKKLVAGDIFVLNPNEISDPVFLTDCDLIVVKIPSSTKDKYEI